MKVATIGTGNMGTGLGRQFAAAGHEVIVGSRDRERAKAKAEEIGAAGPASVLIASDDAEAKEAVASLARDAGYDPVDAGPLWSAFNVEKVVAVMITIAYVVGAGTNQALKIVGR
jgi:predicted dinucleotide-binding enzyme